MELVYFTNQCQCQHITLKYHLLCSSMEHSSHSKIKFPPLLKKLPSCYGNRSFTAIFPTARQLSLSQARPIQFSISHIISQRSILILSTLLMLVPPSRSFPSGLPTKIKYEPLLSSTRATYPALPLHFITSLYLTHCKRTTTAQTVPIQ